MPSRDGEAAPRAYFAWFGVIACCCGACCWGWNCGATWESPRGFAWLAAAWFAGGFCGGCAALFAWLGALFGLTA